MLTCESGRGHNWLYAHYLETSVWTRTCTRCSKRQDWRTFEKPFWHDEQIEATLDHTMPPQ